MEGIGYMIYHIKTTSRFDKEISILDKYTQQMIKSWISRNIESTENPRLHGKALSSNRKDQWRYRIGDYRLICKIQDSKLIILALTIGHRSEIYK